MADKTLDFRLGNNSFFHFIDPGEVDILVVLLELTI